MATYQNVSLRMPLKRACARKLWQCRVKPVRVYGAAETRVPMRSSEEGYEDFRSLRRCCGCRRRKVNCPDFNERRAGIPARLLCFMTWLSLVEGHQSCSACARAQRVFVAVIIG